MSTKTKYIFEIGLIVVAFLVLGICIGIVSSQIL